MQKKEDNILEIVKKIFHTNTTFYQKYDLKILDKNILTDSNQAENFLKDRIAFLFFMIELYKQNPEQDIWIEIKREIVFFEQYLENIIPYNYSLFCGRSCLGFLYIELFRLRKEEIFLLKAKKQVKEYFDRHSFQFNLIAKGSLYDGLSGIFLFVLHLYSETPENWLLEIIEQILDKLISQAEKVGDGVYWGSIRNQNMCNIGVCFGNSGIAFSLYQAATFFKNNSLMNFAKMCIAYENTFWYQYGGSDYSSFFQKKKFAKKDIDTVVKIFSFTSGISGSVFVNTLVNNSFDNNSFYEELVSQIIDPHQIAPENIKQLLSIYEIAAIGLSLSTCHQLSGKDIYKVLADSLTAFCIDYLTNYPVNERGCDGVAIGYFLLTRISDVNNSGKLLFVPLLKKTANIDAIPSGSSFYIQSNHITKSTLGINFKNTVKILENKYPGVLDTFLNANNKNADEDFIFFIKSLISHKQNVKENSELHWIFEKEMFKFNLRKSLNNTSNITYIQNDYEILHLNSIMEKDKETFLLLELKRSPDIWIFNEEPPLSTEIILSTGDFINHLHSYGKKTFIYKVVDYDKLDEYSLEIHKMILDRFIVETNVQTAVSQLSDFFLKQNIEIQNILMHEYNIDNYSQLPDFVKNLIIDGISYFFMEGILVETHISSGSQ